MLPPTPACGEARLLEPAPPDPLAALVRRMDTFLHEQELEGITLDPRYAVNPAEFTRLSVTCQLLGYLELERSIPDTRTHRADIVERADFLVEHFDEIHSGSAVDGMLAFALLGAFEATGDGRYREKADRIVEDVKLLHGWPITLNWGLMAGMALARSHRLSGDPEALAQLGRILESLEWVRGEDGSYPHVCERAPDVHYSGWMAMELLVIARELEDPAIRALALRTATFLAGRVGATGETDYWGPCATCPGLRATYYSLGAGCVDDYDTRAWVNELGYIALALDESDDPRYAQVLNFLAAHENHGAFPDKWAYFMRPDDPNYAWGSEPRSVVRTSILFWTLSMILAERENPAASGRTPARRPAGELAFQSAPETIAGEPAGHGALAWDATRSALRFGLAEPAAARLVIHDVRGRRVRVLADGTSLAAGDHAIAWDRRDERGLPVRPGVYFARLVAGERRATARVSVTGR